MEKGHCVEVNSQTERQTLCNLTYRYDLKMTALKYIENKMGVTWAENKMLDARAKVGMGNQKWRLENNIPGLWDVQV